MARDPLGLSIGHNVASPDEADAVMWQAARAGAAIVKPAQRTFCGGHAGCFEDPDGHLWEVAHNPVLADLGGAQIQAKKACSARGCRASSYQFSSKTGGARAAYAFASARPKGRCAFLNPTTESSR